MESRARRGAIRRSDRHLAPLLAALCRTRMTLAKMIVERAEQGSNGIGHPDLGAMRSRTVGGLQWVLRGQPERNQP